MLCSLALGMVAAESRLRVAAQQAARTLLSNDPVEERLLQAEHGNRRKQIRNLQWCGPEKQIGADDGRRALQEKGGLADLWYIDDGDILCHPNLGAVVFARI